VSKAAPFPERYGDHLRRRAAPRLLVRISSWPRGDYDAVATLDINLMLNASNDMARCSDDSHQRVAISWDVRTRHADHRSAPKGDLTRRISIHFAALSPFALHSPEMRAATLTGI